MMNNKLIYGALGGLTAGLGGLATFFGIKTHKTNKKLDSIINTVDGAKKHIYEMTEVNVADEMIHMAVREKVDKVTSFKVNQATTEVVVNFEHNLSRQIKKAVANEADLNKKLVKKKIEEEVSKIDVDDFKDEAIDEAKKMLLKKTEKDAEEILQKYFKRLDRETDLYESFLDKMSNKKKNLEEISKITEG